MSENALNVVIDQSSFTLAPEVVEYIHGRLKKLDHWTERFASRTCHITQEHLEQRGSHRFVISLRLPQLTLVGQSEEPRVRTAFDRALKKLLRQVNEFKHVLRREHLQKRAKEARFRATEESEAALDAAAREGDLARFKSEIEKHLDALRTFIADDVRQLKRRNPEFKPSRDDLVEATVLEALQRFEEKPDDLDARTWLFEIALGVVDRRSREHRFPSADLSPREVRTSIPRETDDALQYLFGLDNRLSGLRFDDEENVQSANNDDPAWMLENAELSELVDQKLQELPRDWRRSFRLHYMEGYDVPEIGRLLHLSEEQVGFRLRGASEFLRDHLDERTDLV